MKSSKEILQDYASDMLGIEKHIVGAIERQVADDRVKAYEEAHEVLKDIEQRLKFHISALEQYLSSLGTGSSESMLKKAATTVTGAATGLYNSMRGDDPVIRNLRDDYTALNLAAISYTMLHTTALANKDFELANLALKHLKELTPIIVKLSQVIPSVQVKELRIEGKTIDTSVAREAIANTQKAWSPEVIQ
jgi:ferritin-like metal-binding protein YciE